MLKPKRGDIVVLRYLIAGNGIDDRSPTDPKYWVIKRIIATPGDIVETRPSYPERNVIVPKNHYWVEGDEAFHSKDSNTYGPVILSLVVLILGDETITCRKSGICLLASSTNCT
jgi:signal peptidase I